MQLDATDRRFIALVAGPDADFVELWLLDRSIRDDAMSPVSLASIGRRLVDYAKTVARVLGAALMTSPAADADSVVFERVPEALAGRIAFMASFSPDERCFGLTRNGRICRHIGAGRSAALLAGLLPLVVRASRDSALAPYYLQVVRSCLLVESHASVSRGRTAHLFRAYRVDTLFIVAHLRRCGIGTDVIVETTPLASHNRHLLGDTVTLTNPYHVDEARTFGSGSRVGSYRLWGPTEAAAMESVYGGDRIADLPEVVGVYTRGYWLRVMEGTVDAATAAEMVRLEERFAHLVGEFARSHPAMRFLVFPHPQERRRHAQTGESGPGRFEDLDNVQVVADGSASSMLAFGSVGLGIMTPSTVGFDRIYMGFRTIFFTGGTGTLDRSVDSPYRRLFFDDETLFSAAIEREAGRTHGEFMSEYFAQSDYPGWSAAPAGAARR